MIYQQAFSTKVIYFYNLGCKEHVYFQPIVFVVAVHDDVDVVVVDVDVVGFIVVDNVVVGAVVLDVVVIDDVIVAFVGVGVDVA